MFRTISHKDPVLSLQIGTSLQGLADTHFAQLPAALSSYLWLASWVGKLHQLTRWRPTRRLSSHTLFIHRCFTAKFPPMRTLCRESRDRKHTMQSWLCLGFATLCRPWEGTPNGASFDLENLRQNSSILPALRNVSFNFQTNLISGICFDSSDPSEQCM